MEMEVAREEQERLEQQVKMLKSQLVELERDAAKQAHFKALSAAKSLASMQELRAQLCASRAAALTVQLQHQQQQQQLAHSLTAEQRSGDGLRSQLASLQAL